MSTRRPLWLQVILGSLMDSKFVLVLDFSLPGAGDGKKASSVGIRSASVKEAGSATDGSA